MHASLVIEYIFDSIVINEIAKELCYGIASSTIP